MIWVVSSNILWRSLALFMNDKWTVHRSMGSAINWNQAPCLRWCRLRGPKIYSFRWFGVCFLKGFTRGNWSEHLVISCPFLLLVNKNSFGNGVHSSLYFFLLFLLLIGTDSLWQSRPQSEKWNNNPEWAVPRLLAIKNKLSPLISETGAFQAQQYLSEWSYSLCPSSGMSLVKSWSLLALVWLLLNDLFPPHPSCVYRLPKRQNWETFL